MCRLYGFRATEPTPVESALVHGPHALMAQSRKDRAGVSHPHGWGVVTYTDDQPHVERQARPAYDDEHFRRAAAQACSRTVIAHVRRASVGSVSPENTHPFVHGKWVFAHNGTLQAFGAMQAWMLETMTAEHRQAIRGATDSEHIFHFMMSQWEKDPRLTPCEALNTGLEQLITRSRQIDTAAEISLNILLTDDEELVGSRCGRPLWYVERNRVQDCDHGGVSHRRPQSQLPSRGHCLRAHVR